MTDTTETFESGWIDRERCSTEHTIAVDDYDHMTSDEIADQLESLSRALQNDNRHQSAELVAHAALRVRDR